MRKMIIISGSPCSGKSTVSDILSKKYGYQLLKTDDYLEKHIGEATTEQPMLYKWKTQPWHELFSRPVEIQHNEEIIFYKEEWPMLLRDLNKEMTSDDIIIEGCAFMPDLIESYDHDCTVIYMVPSESFQREQYKNRTWAYHLLKDSEDPEEAFNRWMLRDIMFAKSVKEKALAKGYPVIIVDGEESIDEVVLRVEKILNL